MKLEKVIRKLSKDSGMAVTEVRKCIFALSDTLRTVPDTEALQTWGALIDGPKKKKSKRAA